MVALQRCSFPLSRASFPTPHKSAAPLRNALSQIRLKSSTSSPPRISIVGGGMAGLSALAVLQKHGVNATLYERDVSATARAHLGSMLDMHEESGLAAIRTAGLEARFRELSRPEAEMMKVGDSTGKFLYVDSEEGPRDRPEIDRTALRQMYIDLIRPESIKWDHALTSIETVGSSGVHKLTFANGATVESDILIGADGAFSRIRPLLSPAKPIFTGYTGAEVSLAPETTAKEVEIANLVGPGTLMAMSDHRTISCQRNSDGRIRTYAWFPESESWTLPKDPKEAKEALLAQFPGWADWLRALISLADPTAIYFRPLYILPIGHSWDHRPGITLLGDAAHLMVPFAGEGANQALQDGLEVALAIIGKESPEEWNVALKEFEKGMFARVTPFMQESHDNMEAFMGPDGATTLANFMKSGQPSAPE